MSIENFDSTVGISDTGETKNETITETLIPQEGDSTAGSDDAVSDQNIVIPPPVVPLGTLPPVASFWRRLGAWIVDGIVIGIVAQLLGFLLRDYLFTIGPYGRLIGFIMAIMYFAVLDSKIGKGQTLGKRLLHIAVRDSQGHSILFGRAVLRYFILLLPFLLNGWQIPLFQTLPFLTVLAAIGIFGIGAAIIYTLIFNRKTGQGLHDMVVGSYVINLKGTPVTAYAPTRRVFWYVSGVLLALPLVIGLGLWIAQPLITNNTALGPLLPVYNELMKDERFFSASVFDRTVFSTGQKTPTHVLDVEVWYKGLPTHDERLRIMNEVAKVVLDNSVDLDKYELLRVGIRSQYDLGIAEGHYVEYDGQPMHVWRSRVSQ